MPGSILAVHVAAGQAVDAGDPIATLEAMKMEHAVVAPIAGTVAELARARGRPGGARGRPRRRRAVAVRSRPCHRKTETPLPEDRASLLKLHRERAAPARRRAADSHERAEASFEIERIEIQVARIERAMDPPLV